MTRITAVELLPVDLAPPVPRSDAIQSFVTQETPIVRIHCRDDEGAASHGTGYSYTIGTGGSSSRREHGVHQELRKTPSERHAGRTVRN